MIVSMSAIANSALNAATAAASAGATAGAATTTGSSSGTTSATGNPTSSVTGQAALTQNFNTFLTLLTTQLQNQDPLSPLDTNQFTQQLVSFSEVEQQINTNTNLTQLIQLQNVNEQIAALPLIGQTIQYQGATAPLVNGSATFSYNLPSPANSVGLVVQNAQGQVVYTTTGATAAGNNTFTWNGQTAGGGTAPPGAYTLQVVALGPNNASIPATVTASGPVSAITTSNGQATFNVSGVQVPITSLISIVENGTSASPGVNQAASTVQSAANAAGNAAANSAAAQFAAALNPIH
jgi:flagellar basal-body rod modification protein FlgD